MSFPPDSPFGFPDDRPDGAPDERPDAGDALGGFTFGDVDFGGAPDAPAPGGAFADGAFADGAFDDGAPDGGALSGETFGSPAFGDAPFDGGSFGDAPFDGGSFGDAPFDGGSFGDAAFGGGGSFEGAGFSSSELDAEAFSSAELDGGGFEGGAFEGGAFGAEELDEAAAFSVSAFDLGSAEAAPVAPPAAPPAGADEHDDVEAFFNPGAAGIGAGFGGGSAFGLYGGADTAGTADDLGAAESNAPAAPKADAPKAPKAADTLAPAGRKRRPTVGIHLGVSVGAHSIHGVLLRAADGKYDVLRQFARQRTAMLDGGQDAFQTPEMDAGDDEVQLTIGDAPAGDLGAGDLFLDAEFGDLGGLDTADHEFTPAAPRRQSQPVVFELKDLLDECQALGFDRPPVAFCAAPPAVRYIELVVAEERKSKARKKADKAKAEKAKADKGKPDAAPAPTTDVGDVKRERLLEVLAETTDEPFDKERVQFLPMTPRDGLRRFLAFVPSDEDPLVESLDLLREQAGMKAVPFRLQSAEVPTLIGLAQLAFSPAATESTAIVRVDAEDTLVILLEGDQLHHAEHMRSVTAFDGPDTVCSRVLLQQDVQGIGTVHNVLVVSEERENELVQGFAAFYPDARVQPLRAGLLAAGVLPPPGKRIAAPSLPALGAALAAALHKEKTTPFADVNMLPKRLRRTKRSVELAVAWHTIVAGVLLFFAVLFFVGSYFQQQGRIDEARLAVAAYPAEASMSSRQLQARIDSLESVHVRITRGLRTVDSLLVGSDVWSRGLSRAAAAADAVGGVWVDAWEPGAKTLVLRGRATARGQVVQLAERLGGSITSVAFTEIRSVPVYQFELDVPLTYELPEVAVWLREQAAAAVPGGPAVAVPLAATADGPATALPYDGPAQ